jgi:aryl-alcohol dehydrogenase-like predicted oxidoreductase
VDDFHWLVGKFHRGEAIALMRKAFDLGVTLFDAAGIDAYNTSRL